MMEGWGTLGLGREPVGKAQGKGGGTRKSHELMPLIPVLGRQRWAGLCMGFRSPVFAPSDLCFLVYLRLSPWLPWRRDKV